MRGQTTDMAIKRIALMVSGFEGGGVERNFANLALGLSRLGVECALMAGTPEHAFLRDLDGFGVRVLPVSGARTAALGDLMRDFAPQVLMTGKVVDDIAAISARAALTDASPKPPLLVTAVGTLLSGRFAERRFNPLKHLRDIRRIRAQYRRLDGITAISAGVADDVERVFGVRNVPIRVLNNPIIPDDAPARGAARCAHPWLASTAPGTAAEQRPPVIIAVAGLRRVKGFDTLIKAFARLALPQARLLILGEGKERARLESLARRLGVAERIDLPGFVADPYPYLARSRLLVLSSKREGLGNVVIEAMAQATPVVATDCSDGLSALTRTGALGPLVPVGDPGALARAIEHAIEGAPAVDPGTLVAATEPFRIDIAARAHLAFFESLRPEP